MSSEEIPVPKRLRKPHRYIVATRKALTDQRAGPDHRLTPQPGRGVVDVCTSREQFPRALRILQAVFAEAERRGWPVETAEHGRQDVSGVAIAVDGHKYAVSVTEQLDQVPLTREEVDRWKRDNEWRIKWNNAEPPAGKPAANGRLRLSLPSSYGSGRRSNWSDGPRGSVEGKLRSVFRELEERAVEDTRRAEERANKREELQREQEERERRARLVRIDRARAGRLSEEIAAWRLAADVRRYVTALTERFSAVDAGERGRLAEWCAWAMDWADRSDPVSNTRRIVGFDDQQDALTGFGS